MVCRWVILAPRRSTGGALGGAVPSTWPAGGGDTASWQTQHLPVATEVPTGGVYGDRHCKLRVSVPFTTLCNNA